MVAAVVVAALVAVVVVAVVAAVVVAALVAVVVVAAKIAAIAGKPAPAAQNITSEQQSTDFAVHFFI